VSNISDLIMKIRNSGLPGDVCSELEKRLIREGPGMDVDLAIREASAPANTPAKMPIIEEFNDLERNRIIDSGVRNKWIKRVEKEGATPEILAQLQSFRQRKQEILEEREQQKAERQKREEALQQSLQVKHDPDAEIRCPKCGSSQLTANTKGYGAGKAVVGTIAFGPLGLLGGFIGSKKILITCLRCGNSWTPGA
jgi:tellurium resistance protein TerD